jgi:hypothetical protein
MALPGLGIAKEEARTGPKFAVTPFAHPGVMQLY